VEKRTSSFGFFFCQAVKTEEGKQRVKEVIKGFEERQATGQSLSVQFDFTRLRKKLGLK